jgi:hypothetical protein
MSLSNTYIPTVPQGNQQINNTQSSIQRNFQDIYDLLAINHIPFNTADTFGKHNFVSYVEQGSDPSTLSGEMALYSKSVVNDPNGAELFYRYPNNGNIVQLTGVSNSSNGGSGATSGGIFSTQVSLPLGYPTSGYWQYLSNGILIISFTVTSTLTNTINPLTVHFPSGTYNNGVVVPTFTQPPFNIQLTAAVAQNTGQTNYGATVTSNTTALIYNLGLTTSNSSFLQPYITLIGI